MSSGDIDLAVGYFDNLTTGFRQSFLFRDRYVCVVRAAHPKFAKGMTVAAFQNAEHAIAHSTGMAHANIDQLLARHQVRRKVALSVPGFHVLPMLIPNSDLVAVVPGMLAEAYASHLPIKVLAMPVPIPPFDLRIYWHERYHHDAPIRWLRRAFVQLFRSRATTAGPVPKSVVAPRALD